jgi:hypothetical protein
MCELTLIDSKMNRWKPSQIASACVFLAKKILKRPKSWCLTMQEQSGYSEKQVRECAHEIVVSLNSAPKLKKFSSLYAKFGSIKFGRVASIPVRIIEEAEARASQQSSTSELPLMMNN